MTDHKQRAFSFDSAAARYDAARPGYPPVLFDAVEEEAGRPLKGARVIDIGAGTGIATRLLRDDPATMRMLVRDVNGAPGLVFVDPASGQAAVFAFTVHDGRITEIDAIANPDKLRHLDFSHL